MNAAVSGVLTLVVTFLSFQSNALKQDVQDVAPVDPEFIAYLKGQLHESPTTAVASPVEEVDMQGFDQLISLSPDPEQDSEQEARLSVAAVAPAKVAAPIANAAVAEQIARKFSFDHTAGPSSLQHHLRRKKQMSVAAVAAEMKPTERKLARSLSLKHLSAQKKRLSIVGVAPAEKASIVHAALPPKKEKTFVHAAAAKRKERKLTTRSSLQHPAAQKNILSAAAIAATMTGREQTLMRTPVRMPGSGWCQDANGQESTARRVVSVKCMDAHNLCSADASCVAWACNDDFETSILYTSMGCEMGCEETRWLSNPNLIEKAGYDENGGNTKWRSALCYRWTDGESHPVVPAVARESHPVVPAAARESHPVVPAAARESHPVVPADVIESNPVVPVDVAPAESDDELSLVRKASLFVRVPGNGLCMDASNTDTAARRFIQGNCDRAEHLCGEDVSCVAWNCHDNASPFDSAILYTDKECSEGCNDVQWLAKGPGVVDHAAPVQGKPEFASHSCYKWRT